MTAPRTAGREFGPYEAQLHIRLRMLVDAANLALGALLAVEPGYPGVKGVVAMVQDTLEAVNQPFIVKGAGR